MVSRGPDIKVRACPAPAFSAKQKELIEVKVIYGEATACVRRDSGETPMRHGLHRLARREGARRW